MVGSRGNSIGKPISGLNFADKTDQLNLFTLTSQTWQTFPAGIELIGARLTDCRWKRGSKPRFRLALHKFWTIYQ